MTRTRTPWRRLAAVLSLLPLAACGIQKSDVVEAGGAATVAVYPTNGVKMVLFLVGPDGRLMPTVRDFGLSFGPDGDTGLVDREGHPQRLPTERAIVGGYRIATDKVLSTLLEGPDQRERAAGLTTRLALHGAFTPHTETRPGPDGGDTVLSLRLAVRVQDLDPVAVQQLVCTAAYAEELGQAAQVVVSGIDASLPATRCEAD
ncbi:hypothetical protein ACIRTB_24690 [Streptomyces sp. NPDC101158]|uniref:hypothetical protein n=1 Tax=Streptomyces sp. NPDC101158 TaxID=3366117 RepID=UPI00381BB4F1